MSAARRIGLVVPSSNTVVELDFHRGAPADVTVHTARMHLVEVTAAAEREMLTTHLPAAVRDITTARPDVVAFACTSAGALLGPDGESALIESISASCGAPVVSTNGAVGEAIERQRPASIAVLTPYVDELNAAIRRGLEGRGLEVVVIKGMGIRDNLEIGAVTPAEIVAYAERSLRDERFDLLFVSCTNFRAMEAIPELEARFSVPVITSNQATLEASLAVVGGNAGG